MSSTTPLQIVHEMYAAFRTGDVQTILSKLSENVDWETYGPAELPIAGRFDGHSGALRYFATLAQEVDQTLFEPREFVADDENVVVHGLLRGTVRRTGREYETNWVHKFTIRDGKVVRVRALTDSARIVEAFRPADAGIPA